MFNSGSCPIAFHPRRLKGLPAVGQQVRVAVQKTIELWQGSRRVRFNAGDAFVGTVAVVGDDGLLDLEILGGLSMCLHARDTAFTIEPYEG